MAKRNPQQPPAAETSTSSANQASQPETPKDATQARQQAAEAPPTCGRVVHFFEREEAVEAIRKGEEPPPTPAIVRRYRGDGFVDLVVFTDFGPQNVDGVRRGQKYAESASWAWPPR